MVLTVKSKQLGKRMRIIRRKKGMTLTAFAHAVGVAVPTASEWELGVYSPRLANLRRAVRVLGCEVSDLI